MYGKQRVQPYGGKCSRVKGGACVRGTYWLMLDSKGVICVRDGLHCAGTVTIAGGSQPPRFVVHCQQMACDLQCEMRYHAAQRRRSCCHPPPLGTGLAAWQPRVIIGTCATAMLSCTDQRMHASDGFSSSPQENGRQILQCQAHGRGVLRFPELAARKPRSDYTME